MIFDLPASKTVINTFLLFISHLVRGILLRQPKETFFSVTFYAPSASSSCSACVPYNDTYYSESIFSSDYMLFLGNLMQFQNFNDQPYTDNSKFLFLVLIFHLYFRALFPVINIPGCSIGESH